MRSFTFTVLIGAACALIWATTGLVHAWLGKMTCDSFSSQKEAEYVFDFFGGSEGKYKDLDRDQDGEVCESL